MNVRLLEADCYVLEKTVRFSGVYERRRNRLVMVKPADRDEGAFEWEIDEDCLILVKQRPVGKLGSDYRGATLKRTGRASERSKAPVDDPILTIEIRPASNDAKPVVPKCPSHYKLFEKRIQQLEDKRVLELVGTKVSLRLLNNARLNKQKEPSTAAEFACAILRGRIVSSAKMVYDLQRAEECLVTTPRGDFRVGIFYPPVGYIVLPNGECYWFFSTRNRSKCRSLSPTATPSRRSRHAADSADFVARCIAERLGLR